MKKFYISILTLIIISCNSSGSLNINSLIENGDLEELIKRKKEYVDTMNNMQIELNEINDGISFLDENEKLTLVSNYEIKEQVFNSYIEAQANLKTRKNVLILPEFQGTLEQIFVDEGQNVQKGKLLAEINDSGLKEQLEQLTIQANFAKENFERTERLWNNNIGSEIQFLKSKTDFESSQKMVEQMKDRLAKTKIYAPFDGEVDEIISNQGSNLIPGVSQILRLVNLDKIYAEAFVSEKYISFIDEGTEAIVHVPLLGKEINSKIIQTGNFINPSNRTFRIEVPVENIDNKIKQNLDAKIKINIYSKKDAVVIPLRIVREDASGKKFVYVMNKDIKEGVYITVKTFISLGNKNNTDVEIIEGLKIGDMLVLEGASIVEDSQRVKLIN
ncbi:MAG: efflux RND transporter periplasmic adaptor subunit [Cryomorphaceae bacterium]|jgi:RND family efflux transporter MFP subunit|nr:efflux RND transporter periplasmic adaptor subunit [Cryomorphaceae bacterium]MBT3503789.1 efflux RND transporter periplasmic adaptor subunit [Cryomorphaceae bacterium]MBT3688807.1 efflux RND transporter periplasmic adaptor subunit [Cryomorphaceae bacterium]MBT4518314.1 efflux RND transporter periplasmic adaptor subunit [Cryomorphaceae bacterium]MBT4833905.1 efflux RND transporter periplasmic adaptor subunit [Cryomorphaceae bacterium]